MNKVSFKGGALLAPLPPAMVSCGDENESNIITIAWTGIINSDPPITYISVRKSRHSHSIIEKSGEFIINIPNVDIAKACDFCGVKSGRNINKWKEAGLTKRMGDEVKCPMISEAPLNLECKVIEKREYPTHDMFVAEIVKVHADEKLMSENGKLNLDKAKIISYCHGEYFELKNKSIGGFGFSVMKPKTKRKKDGERRANQRLSEKKRKSYK